MNVGPSETQQFCSLRSFRLSRLDEHSACSRSVACATHGADNRNVRKLAANASTVSCMKVHTQCMQMCAVECVHLGYFVVETARYRRIALCLCVLLMLRGQ